MLSLAAPEHARVARIGRASFAVSLVMNAEDSFFGYPSLPLPLNELPYSLVLYELEVFDLTHAISRPVPVIEVPQSIAGKFPAIATEPAGAFAANTQRALHAGLGLVLLGVVASVAGMVLPQERSADSTIHPARGYEVFGDPVSHVAPRMESPGHPTLIVIDL